ncbi:hypothetical protein, partial [Mesorhizobium sp. M2D.F.Ca.ET.224.01.1.1]|uniref:hypothetical protein n=1 Tax=Mesorhizobium sp. M2D.F.Ca.ET.224.01.1.1 TaxID=2563941 RepID=UPI001AED661F
DAEFAKAIELDPNEADIWATLSDIEVLAERQIIPARRKGIEPERLADVLQALVQPPGQHLPPESRPASETASCAAVSASS